MIILTKNHLNYEKIYAIHLEHLKKMRNILISVKDSFVRIKFKQEG